MNSPLAKGNKGDSVFFPIAKEVHTKWRGILTINKKDSNGINSKQEECSATNSTDKNLWEIILLTSTVKN